MASGIVKISQPGYDVTDPSKPKTEPKQGIDNRTGLPHMIAGLALPYLHGAITQVDRYKRATLRLNERSPGATLMCLHEVSSLFEDLDTVDRYTQMCGGLHKMHDGILNIRNHIRHDLRDNLDHENNKGRKDRARKLGIPEQLITDISFEPAAIKVGTLVVQLSDIDEFLQWAEEIFGREINVAREKGLIKGVSFTGGLGAKRG